MAETSSPAKMPVMHVPVYSSGEIDLSPLYADALGRSVVLSQWRRHLQIARDHELLGEPVTIIDLLRHNATSAVMSAFTYQVLWWLATQCESRLGETAGDTSSSGPATFSFSRSIVEVGAPNMREQLFQYVCGGVSESQGHNVVSVSVDKAAPCSGNLSNGIIVWPNNKAVVAVPQAVLPMLA